MTHPDLDDLQFDADEMLVLTVMQQLVLGRDLIAEKNAERSKVKARFRDAFAQSACVAHWSRGDELPVWARGPAADIAAKPPAHQRMAIEMAASVFGAQVEQRSRALLLLIELFTFHPWAGVDWNAKARKDALAAIAGKLPALQPGDLDRVTAEFAAVARALAKKNVKWGRVAALSAAGLALGVITAGAAAPLIGAAVGGALGPSGAAATSAGLAALGGGSLAAGGFGMAGGTFLLAGLGGIGGAGFGAAGAGFTGFAAAQVVRAAVKLDVITKLVILDAEGDDAKARLVVEGLQARFDEVTASIGTLADRLRLLKTDNAALQSDNTLLLADNAVLAVRNQRLRDEHKLTLELEKERETAQMAQTALQTVILRLMGGS